MERILFRLMILAQVAVVAVACGKERRAVEEPHEPAPVPAPVIIERVGVYSINGGLEVFTVEHLALGEAYGYRLGRVDDMERHGVGIIGEPQKPWFFHNASNGKLWAYVETEGVTRWTQDDAGKWHADHYDQASSNLPDDMPMVFYERLPTHEKSRWVPDPNV